MLMEQHCWCRDCGRRWVVNKTPAYRLDLTCCGWTSVREVPGQLLLSDEGGAWLRRTGLP